jgi:hypothetical protein
MRYIISLSEDLLSDSFRTDIIDPEYEICSYLNGIPIGINMRRVPKDPDMLEEFDFSKGLRGKYAKRYAEG